MNTLELLVQVAELEKKAYTEYITDMTTTGITTLVQNGIDFEKAASLMREACEQDVKIASMRANIVAFEKSAERIVELEGMVDTLEKAAGETELTVAQLDQNNPMSKFASIGFTPEEIRMLSELPQDVLTKVANASSQPNEMGGGVGIPREKTDPLLEFLLR